MLCVLHTLLYIHLCVVFNTEVLVFIVVYFILRVVTLQGMMLDTIVKCGSCHAIARTVYACMVKRLNFIIHMII